MKKQCIWIALFALFITVSCEKPDFTEDEEREEKKENVNDEDTFDAGGDSTSDGYLSVAEAIQVDDEETIIVKAYIVGATTRTMKYATFTPPFVYGKYELKASILLGDSPATKGMEFYDGEVLPVCINEYKRYQNALNLYDHEELWNKQIIIMGKRKPYYNRPGLKSIMGYEILDNEE